MAIRYKTDANILERLKDAGYTSYRMRKEKIFGESTLQKFRTGVLPSWNELDKLCAVLDIGPWEIIEYTPSQDPDE